jgi:putative transposase
MTIRPELLDELLKDYQTPQDLFGENGIIKQLTKGMIERGLQAEMQDHLGYAKHGRKKPESANTRNGKGTKTLKSEHGELEISVPRDRDGSFEPLLVKKRQSRLEGFLREDPGALCAWDDHQRYCRAAPGMVWRGGLADVYLQRD